MHMPLAVQFHRKYIPLSLQLFYIHSTKVDRFVKLRDLLCMEEKTPTINFSDSSFFSMLFLGFQDLVC